MPPSPEKMSKRKQKSSLKVLESGNTTPPPALPEKGPNINRTKGSSKSFVFGHDLPPSPILKKKKQKQIFSRDGFPYTAWDNSQNILNNSLQSLDN